MELDTTDQLAASFWRETRHLWMNHLPERIDTIKIIRTATAYGDYSHKTHSSSMIIITMSSCSCTEIKDKDHMSKIA